MNSPIILRISHISGMPHTSHAAITLTRDALLDHETFEHYLTPEQFAWLVNVRCSVRYRSTGMTASWWLQHGSHEYTCSINDQRIACSDSIPLQAGDRIEIGLIRLEVIDADTIDTVVKSPLLPETALVATDNVIITETTPEPVAEIPLLTDIVTEIDPVVLAVDDTDTDETTVLADDIHHAIFDMVPSYVAPAETTEDDDIFMALAQPFHTERQPADHTASSSALITFDHDFSLSDLDNINHTLSDDLSLEEALLGPLSIHQALSHLQANDDEVETDNSAMSTFDFTVPDEETDVLALFTDTTAIPKNTSSTQHIHQSFPDSFCDIGTETSSFELDDTLFTDKETR